MTHEINIALSIPAEEYIRLYQGSAHSVRTVASNGKSIRFPAKILQPFVTREGIYGRFSILYDNEFRFKEIRRQ